MLARPADGLDLPSLQHQAGFVFVLDEIIVEGLAVVDDAHWRRFERARKIAHFNSSVVRRAPMAAVKKIVLIEFTPAQMFDLVDRCEDYPKFLPWCGGSEVQSRDEKITRATLHINYHGIKSHFSTENDKDYPRHADPPDRRAHPPGRPWDFTPRAMRPARWSSTCTTSFPAA
jgi:hypothetical protein